MSYTQRYLTRLPPVIVAGRVIKRYHLTGDHQPIPHPIQDAAYHHLPNLLPDHPHTTPLATVSVLDHGLDTTHLTTYSWIEAHAIDCRAAATPPGDPTTFVTQPTPTTGRVWELPALVHERSAWAKHMLNTPHPDFDAYLHDTLAGVPVAA